MLKYKTNIRTGMGRMAGSLLIIALLCSMMSLTGYASFTNGKGLPALQIPQGIGLMDTMEEKVDNHLAYTVQSIGRTASQRAENYDRELLASLIFCEAGNQSLTGQIAVGAVVMNRIADRAYPNSMEEVIYQRGQFVPAGSGWLDRVRSNRGYTTSAMQAADAALSGENPVENCLYFDQGGWGQKIGAHYFH